MTTGTLFSGVGALHVTTGTLFSSVGALHVTTGTLFSSVDALHVTAATLFPVAELKRRVPRGQPPGARGAADEAAVEYGSPVPQGRAQRVDASPPGLRSGLRQAHQRSHQVEVSPDALCGVWCSTPLVCIVVVAVFLVMFLLLLFSLFCCCSVTFFVLKKQKHSAFLSRITCICCFVYCALCSFFFSASLPTPQKRYMQRDSSVVEQLTCDRVPAGPAGEFSSPGSGFWADSCFSIRSIPQTGRRFEAEPCFLCFAAGIVTPVQPWSTRWMPTVLTTRPALLL